MSSPVAARPAEDHSIVDKRPASVGRMFWDRVAQTPQREAYRFPVDDGWRSSTWHETGEQVRRLAAGLISLGIQPEQRVGIASSTRYEWVLADLAITSAGAATTTVYPSSVEDDVAFIVENSRSRIVFAENSDQLAKLANRRRALPYLRTIVTFDGTGDGDGVLSMDDLAHRGDELLASNPTAVDDRVDGTRPESLATLIYTSGTTGRPKGVRLLHSAWTYEGAAIQAMDILTPDDLQYLWLPMAHSFGKVLLVTQLAVGFPTAVDGRVDKIIENLSVVRPTFMGAAPRIFEKAHARIVTIAHDEGGVKARIFDRAFRVGIQVSRRRVAGQQVPPLLRAQHRLFDRLVFARIRERFGGRVRFFISGAAALNRDVAEWFHAAGILVLEGYGLTETSAGSAVNRPDHFRFGTVGLAFPGTRFAIGADGEILVKGPGVMDGYQHSAEQRDEVLTEDGWLRTGDIGEIDDDGFIRITDRKKDLFKTSGGKYVAPSVIESQFKAMCPVASHFLVHGDQRSFCTALVTLDPDAMTDWADRHGLGGSSYAQVVTSEPVRQMVDGYVSGLNAKLNRWETIKRFAILDHDLSVESGELTPNLKVKRAVVEENNRAVLDSMYG